MVKPLYNAELFRTYLAPRAGLPCALMGIVFLAVGVFVFFLAQRIALFAFLMILGGCLVILGVSLFIIKCLCPGIIPDRRQVEAVLCRCIP